MDQHPYQEMFSIRASEVNFEGRMKLYSLCDLLQEVAGNNALQLNFDITDLQEKNSTWVLQRLNLQIKKYPGWRDRIIIETWPSGGDRLRAYRSYRVLNDQREVIVKGLSYWLILKLENRRPVRIPEEILKLKRADSELILPVKKQRIDNPESVEDWRTFVVRKADLDMNKHVNNTKYVEWLEERIPEEKEISELDIEFLAESNYADVNLAGIAPLDDRMYFGIVKRKNDEKILAKAEISTSV